MQQVYLSHSERGRISGLAILVLLMLGVFVALGTWQLQRKFEKEDILKDEQVNGKAVAVDVPLGLDDYSHWRYRPVVTSGRYLPEQQFLLDNQIRDRVVGYNVLTPFLMSSGFIVLVDRGWVPQAESRSIYPVIDVANDMRTIRGELYTPFEEGLRLGTVDNDIEGWPRLIQYIDYEQLTERLKKSLLPVIVRLDPSMSDGYRRDWQAVAFGPERHLGYAVQWYALAGAMLVIFIILVRKKKKEN